MVHSASRGVSYDIFCLDCYQKHSKWLETKRSDKQSDQATHPLFGLHFKMLGLIVEKLFMLFSIYNAM